MGELVEEREDLPNGDGGDAEEEAQGAGVGGIFERVICKDGGGELGVVEGGGGGQEEGEGDDGGPEEELTDGEGVVEGERESGA